MNVTFHIGDKQVETDVERLPCINEEVDLSVETENGFEDFNGLVRHVSSYYEVYSDGSCSENYNIHIVR